MAARRRREKRVSRREARVYTLYYIMSLLCDMSMVQYCYFTTLYDITSYLILLENTLQYYIVRSHIIPDYMLLYTLLQYYVLPYSIIMAYR